MNFTVIEPAWVACVRYECDNQYATKNIAYLGHHVFAGPGLIAVLTLCYQRILMHIAEILHSRSNKNDT